MWLEGIGPIGHSKHSNRVQMRLLAGNPVVFGNEAKSCIEERDRHRCAALAPAPAWSWGRIPVPIGEPLYQELAHMLAKQPAYTVGVDDLLLRHVAMQDAGVGERRAAFAEAVRQLEGLPLDGGSDHLEVELVETATGGLEIHARRAAR